MDFTTDKIQTLLDPKQGLRAVGLGKLEDLNIKQLQKVAEEGNKIYRIKGYKALSKAKIIEEIKTRFPHLAGEEGKLEDLSLKQIQTITVKYQQQYLIKNINKMNKAQLIGAIRRVAPHLEDTKDVRSPEPTVEPVEPTVVSTDPTEYGKKLDKVLSLAKSPMAFGKPVKRKVLQLGKRYYWKDLTDDPELFTFWKRHFSIPEQYNSLLVNVYKPGEGIAYHTDKIDTVVKGSKVISASLSPVKSPEKLGVMTFSDGRKYDLLHNTKIEFDPYVEAEAGLKHKATAVQDRIN